MRIYIAGPISGIENNNEHAFAVAEQRLFEAGHRPINPLSLASDSLKEASLRLGLKVRETPEYREILDKCLAAIRSSDGVVLLTGWQGSKGAYLEKTYADTIGVPTYGIDELCANPAPVVEWTGLLKHQPVRQYSGDAGFDLYVCEDCRIEANQFVDVSCGVAVALPSGVWAMITGRSSTLRQRGLLVTQGIIDNGFRGELFVGVQNLKDRHVDVEAGDRLGQLIPFPLIAPDLEWRQVNELSETDRDVMGFGSTGA